MGFRLPIVVLLFALGAAPALPGPEDSREPLGRAVAGGGAALVAPAGSRQWTTLRDGASLRAGDRLRTAPGDRGVVAVEMSDGGRVTVGPGAAADLPGPGRLRLLAGEAEVSAPVAVDAPGGGFTVSSGTRWLRADGGGLTILPAAPAWLATAARGPASAPPGRFLVTTGGAEVPLPPLRHEVFAVIHDRIAETTSVLTFGHGGDRPVEGLFRVEVPPGAILTGFGEGPPGAIVPAVIVPRPAGGEAGAEPPFSAPLFLATGEERSVLVRTVSVLPREDDRLRYRYSLRGPAAAAVRFEAQIRSIPPVTVKSPSHALSIGTGAGGLRVRAEAAGAPRDFDLVITPAESPPLTVLRHRAADASYFAVFLAPPPLPAPAPRPIELVILADTSFSMDPGQRRVQAEFLAALLSLLEPGDRFRLAAVDESVAWFSAWPAPAVPNHAEAALARLAARASLGLTDLARGFAEAAAAGSTVVYVGDGAATSDIDDPAAFARSLAELRAGQPITCHCVATGPGCDRTTLEEIARIGGGIALDATGDPLGAAARLITALSGGPPIRSFSFAGSGEIEIAGAGWESALAGGELLVLGRSLPTEGAPPTVTARGPDGAVLASAPLTGPPDESGPPHLPLLFARRRAEWLLRGQPSEEACAEAVALSREHGFLTPLTWFVVGRDDEERRHLTAGAFGGTGPESPAEQARRRLDDLRRQAIREIADLGRTASRYSHWPQPIPVPRPAHRRFAPPPAEPAPEPPAPAAVAPPSPRIPPASVRRPPAASAAARAGAPLFGLELPIPSDPDDPAERRRWLPPEPRFFPVIHRHAPAKPATPADWPPEVSRLVEGFAPPERIDAIRGGLAVRLRVRQSDAETGQYRSEHGRSALLTADHWYFEPEGPGTDGLVHWLVAGRRGSADGVLGLAREIAAVPSDGWLGGVVFGVFAHDPRRTGYGRTAEAPVREEGRIILVFRSRDGETERFEIDEITGDLLETSRRAPDGSLRYVTRFSGWRNAGGLRIAAATEGHDPGSRTVTRITAEVEERPASEVAAEIRRRAAGDWLLLRGDLPEPAAARAATGGDRAGPADWLTLALFEAERGQPDRALEAFHRLRETSPAVPGLDLMEAERLGRAGRRDEAAALLARVAGVLATEREPGMRFEHFLSVAMPALTPEAELGLLEDLRERLPPDFWKDARRRLDLETARLLATVRPDDRIAFLRALVAERSEDPHFLRDAAYTLFNYGDPEEAAAVARAAIRAADRSAPQFATQMRSLLLDCLYRAGNWPEILAETGRWLDLDGQSGAAFSWRLRALDALDRPEEAASLVLRELAEGTPTGLWSSPLDMAVGFALGDQTATVRPSAIPDAYRVPLARAAIRLAKGEEPRGAVLARTILDHPRFRDSPEAASARADLIAALLRPGAALEEPLGRLANLVTIFAPWSGTEAILVARSLESALRARRETADDAGREAIDDLLLTLSEAGGHTSATAALLRERLRAACSGAVNPVLVGRLLLLPFDEENEEAVLCALPLLIGGPTAEQQAMNAAGAARQVVDELLSARLAAGGGAAESRRALAARLGDAASRAGEPLRSWLTLEALRLSVAAGEEPAESERRFVELIQNPPATGDPRLDARFLDQAWTGLSALALGSGGGSEITERVLARSREALSGPDAARAGYRLGRLLAALDRRADLLALLSARPSPVPRFETAEVLLLAAEGRIEEAAAVLEAALEDRLPSAEEYGTLAGLLGLLGRKEKRREALDRRYAALEFHRLAEELRGRLPPATAAAPPSTPDPELYRMFEALLARGSAEEIARSLWLATRDARALTPLIAGVPRGSTEANCAELAGIRRVLLAVEDPAALEVLAAAAREKARVGEDAGRRALRFVEALCALRTAEITGDDGPAEHIAAPALRDAVPVAAPPAERRAWARLLAQLARSSRPPDPGRLAGEVRPFPAPFARELLRLLGALTEGLDPGTAEGAPLAQALAAALWAEGRGEEAIALLARTLEARRPASDTSLPADLLPAADLLAGWCEKAGKYRLAEDLLAGEARRQTTPPQKTRYILKLLALRPRALAAGAALAAGEGASLWHSALREAVDALAELPAESLSEAVRAICDLALAAHGRDIPGVAPALASFYGERITGTLDRAGPGAPDLRVALARTIARTGDPAAAFRMLLEGLEAEVVAGLPPGGDRWSVVARGMGDLGRKELPRELLDRFHAVLLARLKSELAGRAPDLLSGGHEWYWSERKDEVAAEVAAFAARHPDDPAVVLRAAGFLRRALGRPKDGVALLLAGVAVDEPSFGVHETLAKWLVEDRTHAEAVPHLVKCVEMKPDDPSLRLLLLNALAAAGRPEDAARCAGEAEARLRRGAGPPPRSLADLAAACLAAGIPDSAARLFEEAICAASTDSAPAAGWRMGLAKALSTLGRPAEAVRALIGTDGGQHAVREVIAAGKDPARFAAEWARIVTESGRDDGVVRAAVGSLLLDRGDGPAAVRELRIAVSLRPDDPAVFSALLNALDGTDDVEGAIELLSEALRRGATGPDRAVELGRRLGRLRRGTEAARAIASALELAPRDVRARKEYAEALASAWRPEDALAQRAIIVRLTPDDPRAWYELVLANIAKGHIEEARRLLGEMADRPWPRSADDAKRLIQSAESRLPPR